MEGGLRHLGVSVLGRGAEASSRAHPDRARDTSMADVRLKHLYARWRASQALFMPRASRVFSRRRYRGGAPTPAVVRGTV